MEDRTIRPVGDVLVSAGTVDQLCTVGNGSVPLRSLLLLFWQAFEVGESYLCSFRGLRRYRIRAGAVAPMIISRRPPEVKVSRGT